MNFYHITTKLDTILLRLSGYQISRQLDNVFAPYANFHTLKKEEKTKEP